MSGNADVRHKSAAWATSGGKRRREAWCICMGRGKRQKQDTQSLAQALVFVHLLSHARLSGASRPPSPRIGRVAAPRDGCPVFAGKRVVHNARPSRPLLSSNLPHLFNHNVRSFSQPMFFTSLTSILYIPSSGHSLSSHSPHSPTSPQSHVHVSAHP